MLASAGPDPDALLDMLHDTRHAPDEALPETGVPLEWERGLSPMFIRMPSYGTRCSTVILRKRDGSVAFYERTYPVDGGAPHTVHYTLSS